MKTVAERVKALEALTESHPQELVGELSKALNDRSPTIRGLAVELIGDNDLRGLLRAVLPLVNDRDSEVRALAIESIVNLTDDDLPVKTIAGRLVDKDELVRVAAAEALAESGNVSVLEDLYKALKDKSPLVRSFVAEAIGSIGNKASSEVLEKYLLREKDERAQVGFYVGLSKLDGRDVLQNLVDVFQSDDYRVRSAVINSLDQISLKENRSAEVYSFLKEARKKEKTIAVKSSIENFQKQFHN